MNGELGQSVDIHRFLVPQEIFPVEIGAIS